MHTPLSFHGYVTGSIHLAGYTRTRTTAFRLLHAQLFYQAIVTYELYFLDILCCHMQTIELEKRGFNASRSHSEARLQEQFSHPMLSWAIYFERL